MNVRRATINDLEQILVLCTIMHKESNYSHITPDYKKTYDYLSHSLTDENSLFLVLIRNNEIIGLFLAKVLTYFFSEDSQAMDILFFIEKKHRKKSGAYRLIVKYIKWANEKKVKEIVLSSTTGVELTKMEKFYNKLSFSKVGVMYKLYK